MFSYNILYNAYKNEKVSLYKSYWFVISKGWHQKPGMNESGSYSMYCMFIGCYSIRHKLCHSSARLCELLNHSVYQNGNHHSRWTWSCNRAAGNLFMRHNRSKENTLRASFSASAIQQPFLTLHVSHVQHDHKVDHKVTQNNYVLLFQLSFYIYSLKFPILPTLVRSGPGQKTQPSGWLVNGHLLLTVVFFSTLWPCLLCCAMWRCNCLV